MQLIQDGKHCYMPAMKPNRVLYSKCNPILRRGHVNSRKASVSFVSVHSSFCARLSNGLPTHGFSWSSRLLWKSVEKIERQRWEISRETLSTLHVVSNLKWQRKRSLRVKWYRAVRRAEEVSTLRERATMLTHYVQCISGYVNRETIHPQLCFASFSSFPPGLLLHVRLPSLVQWTPILYTFFIHCSVVKSSTEDLSLWNVTPCRRVNLPAFRRGVVQEFENASKSNIDKGVHNARF